MDAKHGVAVPWNPMTSRPDISSPRAIDGSAAGVVECVEEFRKAIVAKAVIHGLIKRADALARYDLSDEELTDWIRGVERHGLSGLKVTRIDTLRGLRKQ